MLTDTAGALVVHAGICARGAGQPAFLSRPVTTHVAGESFTHVPIATVTYKARSLGVGAPIFGYAQALMQYVQEVALTAVQILHTVN